MNVLLKWGVMFVELEPDDAIIKQPIMLGDRMLEPGQFVKRLGHRPRSSLETQKGCFLQYVGFIIERDIKVLIFRPIPNSMNDIYYGFMYVAPDTLLVQSSPNGFWDIRIRSVETYSADEVRAATRLQQLSIDKLVIS